MSERHKGWMIDRGPGTWEAWRPDHGTMYAPTLKALRDRIDAYERRTDPERHPVAWKYADPTEDARPVYDREEAESIAREDPSLIRWCAPDFPRGGDVD